jgi:vacuolar-type H+-ATPase subunit F/Vma7
VAKNIAVIGNSDSIEYFRVLGCETYETKDGVLTEEQFDEVVRKRRFKIILVTEEVFHAYKKLIRRRTLRLFPVVSIIPDVRGAVWTTGKPATSGVAYEELRMAIVKAVGQDIAGTS